MITVAFTRPERRLAESIELAETMGFKVLAAPSLDIIHGDNGEYERIKKLLVDRKFDIVIVSSPTAVEECVKEWGKSFSKIVGDADVIPIGESTERSLSDIGIDSVGLPDEYSSAGLVDYIGKKYDGGNVLIIHSDSGSEILIKGLSDAGLTVDELISYKLLKRKSSREMDEIIKEGKAGRIDVFAFTSPMSAESFFESCGGISIIGDARVAAIGKPTRDKLLGMGVEVSIIPDDATFDSLLKTIQKNTTRDENE